MINVEVVYVAKNQDTLHISLELPNGALVKDALDKAELYSKYPEALGFPVGIYSKQVALDTVLKAGDRVEVYRPLARDPKEKRRQLAKNKKK